MTRKLAILTAALLLAPAASRAEGITFGARLGYAVGMGEAWENADQSDWIDGQIPLQLEVLFRATPELALGPYFSYGWGSAGDDEFCDAVGLDCDASVTRLGVEAIYTFRNAGQFKPWIGAGFGYEWASLKVSDFGDTYRFKVRGWEFLNLQAGADFRVAPRFRMGPFVQLSLSQYSRYTEKGVIPETGEYVSYSDEIPDKGIHQWLQLGVRGSFDL